MQTMRVLARALALALPVAIVAACSMNAPNGQACEPGDYVPITLVDGGAGFMQCLHDGTAYVLYSGPDPNAVPDASVPDGGDAGAMCSTANGEKLGFTCPGCTSDSDCSAGLECFPFNNFGPRCTHTCKSASDCASPSPGCGNMGVCKP